MLVGGWGSINFYHSVWEPPIMYVVWKILGTLGCYVDNEIVLLKIIYLYFKNRALAPLQIPASLYEGPIFYYYLLLYASVMVIFTFPFSFYPLASPAGWK